MDKRLKQGLKIRAKYCQAEGKDKNNSRTKEERKRSFQRGKRLLGSAGIYHSLSLYSLPFFFQQTLDKFTHEHPWTSIYTTPPFILTAAFFFFFISGLILQLMNFNRPQSEHLSSVFLSPKVMDLNHLRVLQQLCVRKAKKVRMKRGGEEGWMIRTVQDEGE